MITEADLRRFETLLRSEPLGTTSMTPSMVDGMLTAAVIGPRFVGPSEFLPWVWDHENGVAQPAFPDQSAANAVFEVIMTMQNRIAAGLMQKPPEFKPLFLIDKSWSHLEWYEGFEIGMNFAVEDWEKAVDERKHFFGPIVSFSDQDVRLTVGADWPALVAGLERGVIGFRDHFRGETRAEFLAAHTPHVRKGPKVGRNDPCPCGSGRKHKKCCGSTGEAVH